MMGVSSIGSVIDLATLAIVLTGELHRRRYTERAFAGLVAAAEEVEDVLDDRLQADLDVEDRDIEAYKRG